MVFKSLEIDIVIIRCKSILLKLETYLVKFFNLVLSLIFIFQFSSLFEFFVKVLFFLNLIRLGDFVKEKDEVFLK